MLCTSSNTTDSKQSLQSLKMASGCLKMTTVAAGTRLIIFNIKSSPVCPKQGAIHTRRGRPFHTRHRRPFRSNTKMASGSLKMTLEAAGIRLINKTSKVTTVCMSKAGSHSIQGMADHSEQTRKQTNKFLFVLLV